MAGARDSSRLMSWVDSVTHEVQVMARSFRVIKLPYDSGHHETRMGRGPGISWDLVFSRAWPRSGMK